VNLFACLLIVIIWWLVLLGISHRRSDR